MLSNPRIPVNIFWDFYFTFQFSRAQPYAHRNICNIYLRQSSRVASYLLVNHTIFFNVQLITNDHVPIAL
jgi:hypothetical protein